ncbi:MAG: PQQ-binding-like beta-propeller repeat protein [Fibrella sp.]|nr:PQQ-binding-like beta-propeller repeat protein [Armatimonadota bacterium]
MLRNSLFVFAGLTALTFVRPAAAEVTGWLNWRGPEQTGVSRETGLPDTWKPGSTNHRWAMDLPGGGTPVIAGGNVYAFGYAGQGADLQEVLVCADAETGKKKWEKRFNDYLSDITYDRYAIGSPCVDAETGNVYVLTSAGVFAAFTGDGKPLWQHPMMESLGRLTFTNGRTGGPIVENDLVLVRGITSNWGGEGAAMDRFYAFDKKSGQMVWSCSPGVAPKDNSFARPVFSYRDNKRVFYTGAGDGSLICVNARTGETVWRYPVSAGGMNATVVLYKDQVIGVHADENLDSSDAGRMTAVKVAATPTPAEAGPPVLDKSAESWRNDLAAISSSPVLVGNRVYQVIKTGQLCSVDADTGKVLWRYKLGPDQLHASPLYADGKLYVPLQNGLFYILKPSDTGVKELAKVQLAGRCIGAPSAWNGKVYVHTTEKLYCFGKKGNNPGVPKKTAAMESYPKAGATVALQIVPSEVTLRPGETAKFTVRGIDANGFLTETFDSAKVKWAKFIPPTARVRSEMDGEFDSDGTLTAKAPSAGAFQATVDGFKGTMRGRILSALPLTEDFESFTPTETLPAALDEKFAYPPLTWIGARFKFDVRELDGNKVLAKTLDNIFFQRATAFFGSADDKNYTYEADVMADGNRRTLGTVGVINQRYYVVLTGNAQELEINSNQERIKATVPFKWSPKVWYRMKTRVDVSPDGSGIVRAKVWKRGDTEPDKWTLEVPHKTAHQSGAPGLFGFAPQSLFKVYVDNIAITANK